MSDFDQILIGTTKPLEELAELLASGLQMELTINADYVFLRRPGKVHPSVLVDADLSTNSEEPELAAEDASVMDGYPADLTIELFRGPHEVLRDESEALFTDLCAISPYPLILVVDNAAWVAAAFRPQEGITRFPPRTGIGHDSYDLWKSFALDRRTLTT